MNLRPDEFLCLARSEAELRHQREVAKILERRVDEDLAIRLSCSLRDNFPRDDQAINTLKEAINRSEQIEPPFLDFDIDREMIKGHEGRHRAVAAREKGIKEIPVVVFFFKEGEFIEKTGEDISTAMKKFSVFREKSCKTCAV